MREGALPRAETQYLHALVEATRDALGARLVGVYLFGSAAYGAYRPRRSDLDLQVVVAPTLARDECRALAHRLAHAQLPCPARRLELVVYAQAAIAPAARRPQFLLNFNTGGDVATDRIALDPGGEASHWFLLDIAMGRELGQTLLGPPIPRVFAPIPRRWCLEALLDSLTWHEAHEAASANSIRNACRGWRYAATATFGSKQAGATWALQQPDCPQAIGAAIREERATSAAPIARDFLHFVAGKVRAALAAEPPQG